MGHDIDLIEDSKSIYHTYITFNFHKYKDKYPGIHYIHGHNNNTVIKILKKTLKKLIDDGVLPEKHSSCYGDPDPKKDLECYAYCLQEFLKVALIFKDREVYWYSDQVFEIIPDKI